MSPDIQVRIVNHDKVAYNMDATVEMILLTGGPAKVRKLLRQLRNDPNFPKSTLTEKFITPTDEEERYVRALALVNNIGCAAGRELNEIGHKGNLEHLYRIFHEGVTSSKDKKVIGSSIERAFFECGFSAGAVIFNTVNPDTTKKNPLTILRELYEAFKQGVEKWAA